MQINNVISFTPTIRSVNTSVNQCSQLICNCMQSHLSQKLFHQRFFLHSLQKYGHFTIDRGFQIYIVRYKMTSVLARRFQRVACIVKRSSLTAEPLQPHLQRFYFKRAWLDGKAQNHIDHVHTLNSCHMFYNAVHMNGCTSFLSRSHVKSSYLDPRATWNIRL